eukprot:TRINITY_DN1501_c0_g1_i1.p1 TRINITY_DN1501_c0_g1~~TRINITY_DN1501_c0_g1_i1.p1  ORF type:complete len:342 (+),score=107.29 TRINITY_DN1501_c0_g1_i1:82-1107(+)
MALFNIKIFLLLTSIAVSSASEEDGPHVRQQRHYDESRYRIKIQEILFDPQEKQLPFEEIQILTEDSGDDEEDDQGFNVSHHQDETHGLVPQLYANYSGIPQPPAESVTCASAQVQCAYRAGCGSALQNYFLGCSEIVRGNARAATCTTHCRHALISLASTPEGSRLMKCNCSGDEACLRTKESLSICEDEVNYATRMDTIVSCSAATWICSADPSCAAALDYYHIFCTSMFKGRSCSPRCKNSISILKRQQAASKLETCFCDGSEAYDCPTIKRNMEELCTEKVEVELKEETSSSPESSSLPSVEDNEIPGSSGARRQGVLESIYLLGASSLCLLLLSRR